VYKGTVVIPNATGDAAMKAQPLQNIKGLQTPLPQQSSASSGILSSALLQDDVHSDCSQLTGSQEHTVCGSAVNQKTIMARRKEQILMRFKCT
jgi:hypothetical protein